LILYQQAFGVVPVKTTAMNKKCTDPVLSIKCYHCGNVATKAKSFSFDVFHFCSMPCLRVVRDRVHKEEEENQKIVQATSNPGAFNMNHGGGGYAF